MSAALPEDIRARLKEGLDLIPAIAQDATSGEVLMLAYMNTESLAQTLATGQATYWSPTRIYIDILRNHQQCSDPGLGSWNNVGA